MCRTVLKNPCHHHFFWIGDEGEPAKEQPGCPPNALEALNAHCSVVCSGFTPFASLPSVRDLTSIGDYADGIGKEGLKEQCEVALAFLRKDTL